MLDESKFSYKVNRETESPAEAKKQCIQKTTNIRLKTVKKSMNE